MSSKHNFVVALFQYSNDDCECGLISVFLCWSGRMYICKNDAFAKPYPLMVMLSVSPCECKIIGFSKQTHGRTLTKNSRFFFLYFMSEPFLRCMAPFLLYRCLFMCVFNIFFLFYKIQCLCHIVWNLIICCFDRMKFPYYSELICLRFRFAIFDYYKEIYEYGTILHWSTYCGCMNICISLSHAAFLILILILIPQQFKFLILIPQQICWTWRSYNFLCSFKIRSVFKRCQHLFKLD